MPVDQQVSGITQGRTEARELEYVTCAEIPVAATMFPHRLETTSQWEITKKATIAQMSMRCHGGITSPNQSANREVGSRVC
jgi:hypothetical protein